MDTDNSDTVRVQVDITKDGIAIKKRDRLAWTAQYDWSDVDEISIETTERNLFPTNESGDDLPINITSGKILIGAKYAEQESSLEDYTKDQTDEEEQADIWDELEEATGIVRDESVPGGIVFPDQMPLVDAFTAFVSFMIQEGYITKEDLPWSTRNATKRYILNTEPVHQDGSQMSRPKEAVPDVYFEAKTTSEQRGREVRQLVEEFVNK